MRWVPIFISNLIFGGIFLWSSLDVGMSIVLRILTRVASHPRLRPMANDANLNAITIYLHRKCVYMHYYQVDWTVFGNFLVTIILNLPIVSLCIY